MNILILHGVNLNMFGRRDPAQYGHATLDDINAALHALAAELGVQVECFQTNVEGELCERILKANFPNSTRLSRPIGTPDRAWWALWK